MSDLDGIQVVLIDDDEDEYILTRDLLEDCQGKPFSLSWVHSYPKALEVVRQGEGDVYLIDFRLGQHSGLDLLREVKASGCDRAMIMLTGQGDVEVDREAMALGASDYLVKGDFTGSILERAIRYALERQRTQSELRRHSAILNNVHDAVFYVDEDAIIRDWNLGAERIFREKSEDVVGSTVMEVCPNRGGGPHPFLEQIEPAVLREGMAEQVVQFQLRCGRVIHVQVKARQMVQDGRRGMVICASDITEQKRLEAEILRVAESEQRRIGQDLHDDLSSQLSGIGCLTKALENRLRQSHEEEAALLEEITKMVSSAGERTRQIAKGSSSTEMHCGHPKQTLSPHIAPR
ncbi:MAG: PAS domain S-box protein, partial [Verrucomicrobiota bacterium]